MKLTIEQMRIQNFKGTREAVIDFGDRTHISGMNGCGKTTIPDAFSWLLFNKDSRGNAPGSDNFREKPLDSDGKEIHNLDTTVEIICKLDGKPFNLRRTQRENWVKKRGMVESTYQGNVSTYWINDVETKQVDFKSRIALIAPDEVFRLIASLSAFNALEWKKRREQLISLSGIDVDASLLSRPEYMHLLSEIELRNVKVDDLKKILTDQRKRTNEELKMIPIRIDEAQHSIPPVTCQQAQDAEYMIQDSGQTLDHVNELIAAERANSGTAGHAQKIDDLKASVARMRKDISDAHANAISVALKEAGAAKAQYEAAASQQRIIEGNLLRERKALEKATFERDSLRAEYSREYATQYTPGSSTCPTCGQQIPEDMILQAKAQFEAAKRERLSRIQERGKAASSEVQQFEKSIAEMEDQLNACRESTTALMDAMAAATDAYNAISLKQPDYSTNPRIAETENEIAKLAIEAATPSGDKLFQLTTRRDELQIAIEKAKNTIREWEAGNKIKRRIADLEIQQREAGERVAKIEQLIGLLEQFVIDRCSLLEESINEKFPTLRWKLFDVQINGGITDTCICMIPCESGLVSYESANTAAQINADVEIVNVLSGHYGIQLPLFVDNSERVNQLAPTQTQLITLAVSNDTALRIEKEA